jgi:hypothetical protein
VVELIDWIAENRERIDSIILSRCSNVGELDDDDRKAWVMNDETLYLMAHADGACLE